MPKRKYKKRGGVLRWRTKKIGKKKYMHVAVVRKKGPRGGRTIAGKVHKKKSRKK